MPHDFGIFTTRGAQTLAADMSACRIKSQRLLGMFLFLNQSVQ